MLSGVPQGSVLGPCLFLIYINDIDLNISGEMLKFADDTKVICPIEKEENGATLQADLDKLLDWSNKWLMQFNLEKCKVMHFGCNNPCLEYTMGEAKLTVTKSEKDLGVVIDSTLNPFTTQERCHRFYYFPQLAEKRYLSVSVSVFRRTLLGYYAEGMHANF